MLTLGSRSWLQSSLSALSVIASTSRRAFQPHLTDGRTTRK